MNIADIREKCKMTLAAIPRDVLIVTVLVLATAASFCLGFLAGRDQGLSEQGSGGAPEGGVVSTGAVGEVVASKAGTKYYSPSCSGAHRIAEDNKVYFASAELARAQGYEPADNCTAP